MQGKENCDKLRGFINGNEYLKRGLLNPNPFVFIDDIGYTWDGCLSYNLIASEWISNYINDGGLPSYNGFYNYVRQRYEEVFMKGNDIKDFAKKKSSDVSLFVKKDKMTAEVGDCPSSDKIK